MIAPDWPSIEADLESRGWAVIKGLLTPEDCRSLSALFVQDDLFRSTVQMERHGYGRGRYRYFAYPLPALIARLRRDFYPPLAAIANRWQGGAFPARHEDFLALCHLDGQTRPTPLLLEYGAGDYNCLHQDLYGSHVFPLQMAVLLSSPGQDFEGGEFVITEQRPRRQSRASVLPLSMGDAAIFAVHHRPVTGARGRYNATLRHGVSEIRRGQRHTLGVIFHDAS